MGIKLIQTLTLMLAIVYLAGCSGSLASSALSSSLSSGVGTGGTGGDGDGSGNGGSNNSNGSISGVSDSGFVYSGDCKGMANEECAVIAAVNVERAKVGLSALTALEKCVDEAQYHADDMVAHNYFAHDGLTETTQARFVRYGLSGSYWGENIAMGSKSVASVMTLWMNSSAHKANILGSNFKSMGVGISVAADGSPYWVQCFSGMQ